MILDTEQSEITAHIVAAANPGGGGVGGGGRCGLGVVGDYVNMHLYLLHVSHEISKGVD